MKFIFSLIKVGICIGLALLALMLLINTTFLHEEFKTSDMAESGVPIPKFTYMLTTAKSTNASFITLASLEEINAKKESYLNNLTACYGLYYYDKANDITITKYNAIDNGAYRSMNISYAIENYCGEDYILSDSWIHEYNNYASLEESSISEAGVIDLIDKLFSAKRNINPIIDTSYKPATKIELFINHRDGKYYLEIKDISENEILVIKTKANEKQFAVYEYPNAKNYLESLK